jgi:hypothetical protein
MVLLHYLVAHSGRLVMQDEILGAGCTSLVNQLRLHLSFRPEAPRREIHVIINNPLSA